MQVSSGCFLIVLQLWLWKYLAEDDVVTSSWRKSRECLSHILRVIDQALPCSYWNCTPPDPSRILQINVYLWDVAFYDYWGKKKSLNSILLPKDQSFIVKFRAKQRFSKTFEALLIFFSLNRHYFAHIFSLVLLCDHLNRNKSGIVTKWCCIVF